MSDCPQPCMCPTCYAPYMNEPVALEDKLAALPQERQDRINAEADRLAALDDLARLGQEFDAAPDPAAIREAALREAAAILRREIERVDAIAPEKKATPHRRDQRKVSLYAVASEYAEIEREILALIPKSTAGGGGVGGVRE